MLSKSSNGTWNRSIPSLFRTAIDYILIPNDKYIVKNIGVMLYLPVLSIAGIVTGIFVGITANFVVNHLKKLPQFRKNVKI